MESNPGRIRKREIREPNRIIIVSPQMYMYYEHMIIYLWKKFEVVILSTRHCRSVMEQLIDTFTKDLKASHEVKRDIEKDDTVVVHLKRIGALK